MNRQVSFAGDKVNLVGEEVKVGDKAKEFQTLTADLEPIKLSDYKGMNVVLVVFPSVDTGVCSMQAHKFNKLASDFGDDVKVITISTDLPFALKRYCGAEGIDNIVTTSDHYDVNFGTSYGFLIEPLRVEARGTVIIDKEGIVQYIEYVDEVTNEPDYDKAVEALNSLA